MGVGLSLKGAAPGISDGRQTSSRENMDFVNEGGSGGREF